MTAQLSLDIPPSAPPDISRGAWHVFSGDTPEEQAAAIYLARYGVPPQYIVDRPGGLPQIWLGPVPRRA